MTGQKQTWWKQLVAFTILTALIVVVPLFALVPQKASAAPSAATEAQKEDCYNTFDGKDINVNKLSSSDKTKYTGCLINKVCDASQPGATSESHVMTCIVPWTVDADVEQPATAALTAPLITKACGPVPSGQAAHNSTSVIAAYKACTDAVRAAYNTCKSTGSSVTSPNMEDTPAPIAQCYVQTVKGNNTVINKISESAALAAITQGISDSDAIILADTVKKKKPAPDAVTDPEFQCELKVWWNPLNWAACAVYDAANKMVGTLDNWINDWMTIDQKKIFDTTTASGQGYYKVWQVFRTLSLALLVIAGLVMVIANALGFEMLDAYTIKKILPRLLVAVIGISLSWQLMEFFVVFTNNLGLGLRYIIFAPFQNMPGALSLGGGAKFIAALLTSGAMVALGAAGLASFAVTAFLAILVAFLVLMIRQLVVIVLILLAPVAIACSILPNTHTAYKLWYESFTKALLMFPLIVVFIAVGRVFAVVATQGDVGSASSVNQLMGFAAYFLPYFLIPMTFSMAGGAMRAIGGRINDTHRGAFDRLKKYRSGKIGENMHAMKTGNRFRSDNILAKGFNATSSTIAAIPSAEVGFNPRKWRQRVQSYKSSHGMTEAAEYGEKDPYFAAIKGNDDYLMAGVKGEGNDKKVEEYLLSKGYTADAARQGTAAIRAARRNTSSEVFETAAALALPPTGTAFKNEFDASGNIIGGGAGEMHDFINEVAGNDSVKKARLLASMRQGMMGARRFEAAGGSFSKQLGILEAQANGKMTSLDATKEIVRQSLEGQGGSYIVGARNNAVQGFAPIMAADIHQTITTGNMHNIDRELAVLAGRYDAMQSAAPENARILADQVLSRVETINGVTQTVQKHIEDHRGDDAFLEMRREYGKGATQGYLQAQQQQQGQGGGLPGQQGGLPGQPGGQQLSDIRLKQAIKPLGLNYAGMSLYSFKYIWDDTQTYIGFMAQEVLDSRPDAVVVGDGGWLHVDYAKLGTRMYTLEEWGEKQSKEA